MISSIMGDWIPIFKLMDDQIKKKSSNKIKSSHSEAVGLKILSHVVLLHDHKDSKFMKPIIIQRNQISSSYNPHNYCFLKSCFLCHKNLCPNKDVYMYRGDQGFCSKECRSRQMYIDEMRELEILTKKMVKSFRRSHDGGRCGGGRRVHHRPESMKSTHPVIFL